MNKSEYILSGTEGSIIFRLGKYSIIEKFEFRDQKTRVGFMIFRWICPKLPSPFTSIFMGQPDRYGN